MVKYGRIFMALLVALSIMSIGQNEVVTVNAATPTNIALNKVATASGSETSNLGPGNAVDGNQNTRWASAYDAKQPWLMVDLGTQSEINSTSIYWERINALDYEIQVSNDGSSFETVIHEKSLPSNRKIGFDFEEPIETRYIRVKINSYDPTAEDLSGKVVTWPTVSIVELEVYGVEGVDPGESDDGTVNYALNRPAFSNGNETSTLGPSNAVDGIVNRKNNTTRWASTTTEGIKWLSVDLQTTRDIKTFIIEWERRNATDYEIQISGDNENWTTVQHFTQSPSSKRQRIVLDEAVSGRYIRLYIKSFESNSEGVNWNTVSVFEFEAYGGVIEATFDEIAESITMPEQPTDADHIVLPTYEGATIEYVGADYNYVIDKDGTIHRPLVDTIVNVNLKIKINDKAKITPDIMTLVKGTYDISESINKKPAVVPELREWFGREGFININKDTVISIDPNLTGNERLGIEEFIADMKDLYGYEIRILESASPTNDGIHFMRVNEPGLGTEGYFIDIDDAVVVEANNATSLYWSTRTLLQMMQSGDMKIPKGMIRDYPKWEVRGFSLDVGRKTFTFDFIEQVSREMSWYKMNDFQVHLNDNYIFLEDYQRAGEDEFTAYSGFRLESDIEGLTNTDVYYTKDEFRSLIKESRVRGLNIVPEIDVPAHSLAFTKVRRDLALGTKGRQADHLDVTNPNTLPFVKDVFNEYLTGNNPVFDSDTIIHIGTDEYSTAYAEPFRQFTDDMLKFIQKDHNRTVRLWGSLSALHGNTPVRSKNVQMNIWNAGWAHPQDMLDLGYDLINIIDGSVYIVPDAGYYYDYLNKVGLYNNWEANKMSGTVIPSGSDQMLGGAFAVWNDMIDKKQTGMSERDIYDRMADAMPTMATKLWGNSGEIPWAEFIKQVNAVGKAPQTNLEGIIKTVDDNIFVYDFKENSMQDMGKNGYDLIEIENANIVDETLVLNGGTSYVKNEVKQTKLGTTLQFSVKRGDAEIGSEEVLFEHGTTQIKGSINGSGYLGFTREGLDYQTSYELPKNEWVDIAITSRLKVTEVYAGGKLIHTFTRTGGSGLNATMLIPVGTIGSETDSFVGSIDNIRLINKVDLDYDFVNKSFLETEIGIYNSLNGHDYTDESWTALLDIVSEAIDVYESTEVIQETVDVATDSLRKAIANLELKELIDLDGLKDVIKKAKEKDPKDYTEDSFQVLKNALKDAEMVLDNEGRTLEDIERVLIALQDALDNLKSVDKTDPTDPIDPTDPTDPTDPIEPTDPKEPKGPGKPKDPKDPKEPKEPEEPKIPKAPKGAGGTKTPGLPKTGEAKSIILPFIAILMIALGYFLYKRRKA